ncbi:hypothetical protein BCR41DRAFT_356731 [Lobosporangium transversale]|uniref:Ketoreductase domain-containing protein n=1 Tax=Lobosporangium transversale TaxID=64571 RepID=A0A1Y2GLN4_9FUNG|nr:hypothetical protein BCR41DRAFT_357371 [Lobosporangium transversale]XP_021879768.1 hypothetical protein BCR41DRAFT_356731 [Lobosporangium transversale]ORZ11022.1 hypothetical protein BCR41DRAFT_357371 [Lobosporangium transversale]ORZ11671.1 hypothetical protein BCR41DRAFT_356731 [Lobosporangium transversale]|eukprot:XP_021879539.1 hypothetical protein BCR41DRAFT_357371 [Lobosporangium transversale]
MSSMQSSSLFDVKDKVVLVTGGSRGIGLMIAHGFIVNGAKVYISSRSAGVCDKVADELTKLGPGKCISLPADLQSMDEVKRLVAEISKRESKVHVLVNNAGATWGAPIESYPDEAFEKVMNLNLKRVFSLTQAMLPLLDAAATEKTPASIINIGSVDGIHVPTLETYAYSASKAALHQMTRVLAGHLGHRYITCNAIAPGPFQSKMMAATLRDFGETIVSNIPMGRIGQPEDIAATCIYLASRAGAYTTGAIIPVDGGALVKAKA